MPKRRSASDIIEERPVLAPSHGLVRCGVSKAGRVDFKSVNKELLEQERCHLSRERERKKKNKKEGRNQRKRSYSWLLI